MLVCDFLAAGLHVDDILNSSEHELLQNLFAGLSVDSGTTVTKNISHVATEHSC